MKKQAIIDQLQTLLASYTVFSQNARNAHWNVQGMHFFGLHAKFEELYTNLAEKTDEVAERILMLGAVPHSKLTDAVRLSKIVEANALFRAEDAIANILTSLEEILQQQRQLLEQASKLDDEATITLMSDCIKEQEKLQWMYSSLLK